MKGPHSRCLMSVLLLALSLPLTGKADENAPPQQAPVPLADQNAGQSIGQSIGQGNWQEVPLDQLRQAAKAGAAAAQYALGLRLERGSGLLQNYPQARHWFTAAAQQGHAGAQLRLGHYYHGGLGGVQDRARAIHWLEQAARKGTGGNGGAGPLDRAQALTDLAAVLEQGGPGPGGMEQADPARAAQLYRQAADLGHSEAVTSLGVLYQNGSGVPQDFAEARRLYEVAAAAGHARAQNNLGLLYVRGNGVVQDYARAAALFQAAAEQGLAVAMGNLATMYENGFGVPLDEALAADLYRRAGRASNAEADIGLRPGAVFDTRLVPPRRDDETLAQLRQGAERDDPLAQFLLGWLLLQQEGLSQPERLQAAELLRAAADAGYPPAMANLGLMYIEGRALPQDYVLGYMWLVLAATAGQEEAAALGAVLSMRMTQTQVAQAQERAARWSR